MTLAQKSPNVKKFNNKSGNKKKRGIAKNFAENLEGGHELWFEEVPELEYDNTNVELKVEELNNLNKEAKKCFDAYLLQRTRKTTSQDSWLKTAVSKGTSKDRATAGALLVESDPISNLSALNALIGQCKAANKECLEVIDTLTELFLNSLLPKDRKLKPLSARAAEFKALNAKTKELGPDGRSKILAYWHFEAELKDSMISFVRNLQSSAGLGLEVTKSRVISCAARLLENTPEQEQALLSLLINKLGDPSNKVASKTIYHLKAIAHRHPNMCTVIVKETEKLLFRNNLPRKAQHYALCFLGQIGNYINSEVAERMVRICIAFFKACVNKGEVETRTMSTILQCVRQVITKVEAQEGVPVIPKDLQETMFRIIYATNFKISIQALGLIMQIEQGSKHLSDKFFSALYKRLQDPQLYNVTSSTMAMCLNIIYRALLADHIMIRCIAFIKRLLQISFYMPVPYACGFLIVISKVLQTRKGLFEKVLKPVEPETIKISKKTISKNWMDEEEDGDEVYKDVEYDFDKAEIKKETDSTKKNGKSESSWVHVDNKIDTNINVVGMDEDEQKPDVINPVTDDKDVVVKVKKETVFYDPYNRNPLHAGANLSLYVELLKLKDHFHPTVQLFAENIFVGTKIDYDGDPLVDFTCKRFLERFSFKNPKKVDLLNKTVSKKLKLSKGSRGRDVRLLNEFNVTEDERFIFEYLEKQREMKNATRGFKDDESESDNESVDDDEFDDYLDKIAGADKDDLNYMEELGNNLRNPKSKGKQGESDSDDGDDDLAGDQDEKDDEDNDGFDDNDDELEEFDEDDDEEMDQSAGDETLGGNDNFSDLGSDDEDLLNDLGDDDDLSDLEFSDDEPPTKKKKGGKKKNGKEDIASLFANADDFAHLLDEAGASKQKLGTSSAVLNKDKSSDKQLKWEEKRRQNFKGFGGNGKKFGGKKGKKRH